MRPAHRAVLGLVGWVAFLTAVVVGLHALGGVLAPPPLGEGGGMGTWFDRRQPTEAVFAVLRLIVLGLAWYLLAVTVAGSAGRVLRLRTLVGALDAVTVPAVRRLVDAALGISVAAAVLAGSAGVAGAVGGGGPPPVEIMRRLPDAGVEPGPAVETMRRLPDAPAATAPAGTAPAAPAPGPAPAPASWTVAPGDHFWSVAERLLAQAWLRPAADAEVDPYWRSLVAANRSRLRDPGNPDLLFPGQVLVVPPVPAVPA